MTSSKECVRSLIGVGIGRPHEPVGIVRLQRTETLGKLDVKRGKYDIVTHLQVTAVESLPRGDHYGAVADAIAEMEKPAALLIDITVCGRAALPPLRDRGLRPIPIVATDAMGGRAKSRLAFEVGRAELRSAVLVAAEEGRLKVGKGHDALLEQMRAARGTKPKRPGDFEEEPRFELANALARCVWWSEFRMPAKLEQPRAPAMPIEIRPPTFNELMAMARR